MTLTKIEKLYSKDESFAATVNNQVYLVKQIGDITINNILEFYWRPVGSVVLNELWKLADTVPNEFVDYIVLD